MTFAASIVVAGNRGWIRNRHPTKPSLNTTCDGDKIASDFAAEQAFVAKLNLENEPIRIYIPMLDAPNGKLLHGNDESTEWEWDSETVQTVMTIPGEGAVERECRRPKWWPWTPTPSPFTVAIPCAETKFPMLVTEQVPMSELSGCPDANGTCEEAKKRAIKTLEKICKNDHRGIPDSGLPEAGIPGANTFVPGDEAVSGRFYHYTATMDCRLPGINPK